MAFFRNFWGGGKKKTKETQPAPERFSSKPVAPTTPTTQHHVDDPNQNEFQGYDENGLPFTVPDLGDLTNMESKPRNRNVSISKSGRTKYKKRSRVSIPEKDMYGNDYKAQENVSDRTDAAVSHAVPSSNYRDTQCSSSTSRIACTQAIPTASQTTAV